MTTQALLESVLQAPFFHTAAVIVIACLLHLLYRKRKRVSISYVPGPEKTDPFFGNLTDLYFKEAGEPHFQWQEKYGQVFKFHGLLGEEHLMVSDPKAIQHVYANPYAFTRQKHSRNLFKMLVGPGLTAVGGDDHKRQRKVMQPAFGSPQIRGLFPVFIHHAQKLVQILKQDIAGDSNRQSLQVNVHDYVARVTLDIIGDALFHYQFCAVDGRRDKLKEATNNLEAQSLGNNSKSQIFVSFISEHLPEKIIEMMPHLPTKKYKYIRQARDTIATMAAEVMAEKRAATEKGLEGGKDLMSLLLRANAEKDKRWRMSDEEVNAGIAMTTFAGHGGTAATLVFALWELAKSPETQGRLRDEILAAKRDVSKSTGTDEIPVSYYERMSLLIAVTKETLRMHPIAPTGAKQAAEDGVVPLSQPLKLVDGRSITEIPVSKGQRIWINVPGYNRLQSIFGENPHEFNVDRWLDGRLDDLPGLVGVYGNLITFSHGPRACMGWRFSVLEMQTVLIELLANFEFRLPKNYQGVRRTYATVMAPTIPGNRGVGTRLDLEISVLQD